MSTLQKSAKEIEAENFAKVLLAFKNYRVPLDEQLHYRLGFTTTLPLNQQYLLNTYKNNLYEAEKCIQINQDLIDLIVKTAGEMFAEDDQPSLKDLPNFDQRLSLVDLEKVQVVLKQLVREWSDEGAEERQACYYPIMKEIVSYFPPKKGVTENVKVLVPGAGLGRLTYEIAKIGYTCEGCDFSLFMLITSHFVINKSVGVNAHKFYPWISQLDNNMTSEDQMRCVQFPDVYPTTIMNMFPTRLTMAAGDFLVIYETPDEWDCIATCFFIDCAHNIVDFLEHIYKILKPGGIWINLGPLKYHHSHSPFELSIEPDYATLKGIISGVGFQIQKEKCDLRSSYCQNPTSMSQHQYKCLFFVAKKPLV